jgi:hypothetical protein
MKALTRVISAGAATAALALMFVGGGLIGGSADNMALILGVLLPGVVALIGVFLDERIRSDRAQALPVSALSTCACLVTTMAWNIIPNVPNWGPFATHVTLMQGLWWGVSGVSMLGSLLLLVAYCDSQTPERTACSR